MLDKQKIITAVAEKYRILLSEDDPILTTLFLHDEILQAWSAEITRSLEKMSDEIESISHRVHEDSKAVATRIVGTAVGSGIAEIQEATRTFTEQISAWCEQERTLQARRYQTVLVCAGLSLTISLVVVILHVMRW